MIVNYLKLTLRNIARYRLYSFINISGLALGLCVFLFGALLVNYEYNHDRMFARHKRIYTVGSVFARTSKESVGEYPVARTAYGPLFRREIKEAELISRALHRETLLTANRRHFYDGMRFVDRGFTQIFDFKYIYGDENALQDPRGLIITASAARKYFGRLDVLGQVITLEHKHDLRVLAVIEDVGAASHFTFSFLPRFSLSTIASIEALSRIDDFKQEGDWETLDPADMTYVLLPKNLNGAWLNKRVNEVSVRHRPPGETAYISGLRVRPLTLANTMVWDALGFPVLKSVLLMGLLVLLVACVNYTNLATAQSAGRIREVGLRKAFGANRTQLLTQFLIENLALAAFAMLLALVGLEFLIPTYNGLLGKAVPLDYISLAPWLALLTLVVGFLAGAYPAYIITRAAPIESLRETSWKGRRAGLFRNLMITAQFSISIFILVLVMIIYFQNERVLEISNTFAKNEIVVLKGIEIKTIGAKRQKLYEELKALKGVENVTFASDVPFSETVRLPHNNKVTPKRGDPSREVNLEIVSVDSNFLTPYDIKLVAGRNFEPDNPDDVFRQGRQNVNVVINRLAARQLGLGEGAEVIGKSFYRIPDAQNRKFTVVGLMPDLYFTGPQTHLRPLAFCIQPDRYFYLSLRLNGQNVERTLREIDAVWERVIKNYPIRRSFLAAFFNMFYRLLKFLRGIMAVFAVVALSLALFGLFGLSAFMARLRTKEIGIRKVMGASVPRILGLLIWQFSIPVLWSLFIALPPAYLASGIYLDFFPERIDFIVPIMLLACAISILLAWAVVAGHAIKIARETPIRSLRYE